MDYMTVLEELRNKQFNRNELFSAVVQENPSFKETKFRYLLGKMLDNNQIVRVGRNKYEVSNGLRLVYENRYSNNSEQIIELMTEDFPLLEFQVWELYWLNEFFNHQLSRNIIFLEVENDGCEYVFSHLQACFESVLLKPSERELILYGKNNAIIINRLIREAPKGKARFNVPLEKIIVDLFANKLLKGMLSQGDYPQAISEMFAKYAIDQSKMFRYAKRRNKEGIIRKFLEMYTEVKLISNNMETWHTSHGG